MNKNSIIKEMEKIEKKREETILKSRVILKSAKHAIFSVHKGDLKQAERLISSAKKDIDKLRGAKVGAFYAAVQEYAEAVCFYKFVTKKKIPTHKTLKIGVEDYLLGLSDLTGELARRAVISVVNNNYKEVSRIRNEVERVFELFLGLNLRNSELRKKSDAIKWNLKKVEDIIYDIKTKGLK